LQKKLARIESKYEKKKDLEKFIKIWDDREKYLQNVTIAETINDSLLD
jgi:hypothetical protein